VSTIIPDLVVGEVGFGRDFGSSAELKFYRNEDKRHSAEIADLQRENRELIKRINRLKRALERCAALSEDVANDKHEALLEVAQPL
jgi:chromosome segregation ATPase